MTAFASVVKNGYSKDIPFDTAGNVLAIEKRIDFASLPAPVAAAILRERGASDKMVSRMRSLFVLTALR